MRVVAPTDLLLDAVRLHVALDGHDVRSLRPATLTPALRPTPLRTSTILTADRRFAAYSVAVIDAAA